MSSTIAKALKLLDYFSKEEPELGVSDLARRSGVDKAAIHRMFASMMDSGLIEKNAKSRLYRLGPGVLRLATIREHAFPMESIIKGHLRPLGVETGETAHAQIISGLSVVSIASFESTQSNRVSPMIGDINPMHATASGLVILAYCSEALRKRVLGQKMEAITTFTQTDPKSVEQQIEQAFAQGYGEADQTYFENVHGIAAPIFDNERLPIGAMAVATPSHRMTPELRGRIIKAVLKTAVQVTGETGGTHPIGYLSRIDEALQGA
ncbi:MAG: IclR family transcriptional regulator [Pseudomonadota bacterium]